MIVPHCEQRLLVGPALDFSEEVGQFFMSGQCVAFAIVWLAASLPCGYARLLATKPRIPGEVRGILTNIQHRKRRAMAQPSARRMPVE